jgi:hypothetical protein
MLGVPRSTLRRHLRDAAGGGGNRGGKSGRGGESGPAMAWPSKQGNRGGGASPAQQWHGRRRCRWLDEEARSPPHCHRTGVRP